MKSLFTILSVTTILMAGSSVSNALPGGLSPIAIDDKEVVASANFAIQEQDKILKKENKEASASLVEIVEAKQQVVAGMKYHFILKVKINGTEKKAKVAVWKKLNGEHELTNWDWMNSEL